MNPHATLCSVLLFATCLTAPSPAVAASALVWGPCPQDVRAHPAQQCADLRLPLDYRDPGGRQITIKISRIPAGDPSQRLGTLVFSPGGPGIGGLEQPSNMYRPGQPPELRERYDLVGFDARGVRHSTPVSCGLPVQDRSTRYPLPDGTIEHSIAYARHAATQCQQVSGDLLPHITTANAARDLDKIRAALGEDRISLVGLSYGTYLGAVYATLYPQRTDRFVLDSALHPGKVWYDFVRLGGPGLRQRLPDATSWIAARHDRFGLGRTPAEVHHRYRALTAALDADPITYPGLIVDGNWLRDFTRDSLEAPGDSSFELLAAVWQELGTPAARRAATATTAAMDDNRQAAQWAVMCGDAAWPTDPREYQANVRHDRARYPDDAGRSANITPCAFWPRPLEPSVHIGGSGPRNILILHHLRDPATPWASGLGMRRALAGRSALITSGTGGHGVIGANTCATTLALRYLTADTRILPPDQWCPADSSRA